MLGNRNEHIGRHQRAVRALPANQRFHRIHALGGDVKNRLVHQKQLRPVQGAVQFGLDAQALRQRGLLLRQHMRAFGGEKVAAVAPVLLDAVHRRIGAAQQFGTGFTVFREHADADAGRHRQLDAFVAERGACRLQHVFSQRGQVGLRVVGQQQGKFIPAEPPHAGADRGQGAQAVRKLAQHHIAGLVPEGVVDRFEAVQVNEDQAKRRAGLAGRLAGLVQLGIKVAAVGQAGQLVALCQMQNDGLLLQPLRHLGNQGADGGRQHRQLRLRLARQAAVKLQHAGAVGESVFRHISHRKHITRPQLAALGGREP